MIIFITGDNLKEIFYFKIIKIKKMKMKKKKKIYTMKSKKKIKVNKIIIINVLIKMILTLESWKICLQKNFKIYFQMNY